MKILVPVIIVVLVIVAVLIMRSRYSTGAATKRVLTLEQKLEMLADCGPPGLRVERC
jgi:hypothetical protein